MHIGLSPEQQHRTGLGGPVSPEAERQLHLYINLKLRELDCPTFPFPAGDDLGGILGDLLALNREKDRLLADRLCPVDQRIQIYLYDTLDGVVHVPHLPARTLVLDRYGLARALSLPPDRDVYVSDLVSSYRVRQGVLHNPRHDRRTTQGVFHVAEGGLPVPDDKKAVPKVAFGRLLQHALHPPPELQRLPFTAAQPAPASCFVSLLLRPVVCPEVADFIAEKSLEVRFFAPGGLVSNLDFVESVFGNAGDPRLPENDAALDPMHWTGHTGCVILAPHLTALTKQELGLPRWDDATERQRRDGMCWREPDERYNDGRAFKVTSRDAAGVVVTILADNYFGYCKKEVKSHISYSANLFGLSEEEHAGGALLFTRYDLSAEFGAARVIAKYPRTLAEGLALLGDRAVAQPEGHAVDRRFPDILYVPADSHFDLPGQLVRWDHEGRAVTLRLRHGFTYVLPSGFKVHLEKPRGSRTWRLVGTHAECTLCHKPCTVSGGGKSEISKSISDAIIQGPVFVADFQEDFDAVSTLLARDYSDRFRDAGRRGADRRPILSPDRSLGSVIKLLTPADDYSEEYNAWLETVPQHIKELVLVVKRFHKPEWGENWREHFSVDVINGQPANELRLHTQRLESSYLRVGFAPDGSWRTFGLRKDFHPALKIQMEDDITASIVVPRGPLSGLGVSAVNPSLKFVHNCEYRLFQRPDDAIHRGYDHQTETDFVRPGTFFSNYEPLTSAQARELVEDAVGFDEFTAPMQALITATAAADRSEFFICSAFPRLVDGKPSKNPRYLQTRPDLMNPRETHLAEMGLRLMRRVPVGRPVLTPVNAVLSGRRNNPADPAAGIRPLAVYNPLHYMELPELFMEYICSMTGKSPSTTGAGSEGALTKGPFNSLPPIYDLNATFVSYVATGYQGFLSSAGCVGPKTRVDHDISLLVPEVWCRMGVEERDPAYLIASGYLERCRDFEHEGRPILASRLGYRITHAFVTHFCGRVFNHPHVIFTEEMLQPELQDLATFIDGMDNIVVTQQRVAQHYFNDGSIAQACPPLRALLHIMRDGQFEGRDLSHPEIRALFDRERVLAAGWYQDRLKARQTIAVRQWHRHIAYLQKFLAKPNYAKEAERLGIPARLEEARREYARVRDAGYLEELRGTLGGEPAVVAAGR